MVGWGGRGGTNMLQARHPPPLLFPTFLLQRLVSLTVMRGKKSVLAPGLLEDGITQ